MLHRSCPATNFALFSSVFLLGLTIISGLAQGQQQRESAIWQRHCIDANGRGADGVRLADANGDGLPDIATGWEESGFTQVYLHPGAEAVFESWPSVKVGLAPSVEDAVWVDLNGDRRLDILSSCEGDEQSLRAHLAPSNMLLESWRTIVLPSSVRRTRWMFAQPLEAKENEIRVAVGSKSPSGLVGILHGRQSESEMQNWTIEKLCDAEWIMSLESVDVDRDGDADLLFSDRKGKQSAVYWLENPGSQGTWKRHLVGCLGREVMFLQVGGLRAVEQNTNVSPMQVLVAIKPQAVCLLTAGHDCRKAWDERDITLLLGNQGATAFGTSKSVAAADFNGDGKLEIVLSCEGAEGSKLGLVRFASADSELEPEVAQNWQVHDLGGPEGIKFDRIELVDLDLDGDLDILTCEERQGGNGLGVVWYANPKQ